MGIFQALSVGHTGVRYLPPIRPPRVVAWSSDGVAAPRMGRAVRGSKLRRGGYRGGWTRHGDPGNEGMRAALLIRVYLPLHSCLHRETSIALRDRAQRTTVFFIMRANKKNCRIISPA